MLCLHLTYDMFVLMFCCLLRLCVFAVGLYEVGFFRFLTRLLFYYSDVTDHVIDVIHCQCRLFLYIPFVDTVLHVSYILVLVNVLKRYTILTVIVFLCMHMFPLR